MMMDRERERVSSRLHYYRKLVFEHSNTRWSKMLLEKIEGKSFERVSEIDAIAREVIEVTNGLAE